MQRNPSSNAVSECLCDKLFSIVPISPGNCWSLVVVRGLTVAEEGCYRAPLPLPPTNTSIHLLQVATGAVYFLGYFRDTIIHWSTLPLPSSLRSIWVYGRVGLSRGRGSFRGDQIGTYRVAGGGSTEPTGRYIATRPILQPCESGGRLSGSTRRRFWWERIDRRVEQ